MSEQIFHNANIVMADEVVNGSLVIEDGKIKSIAHGQSSSPAAIDLNGDYVMPGLVELHTDNLEKHMTPRPKTEWPSLAAIVAHDNQIASAGITTVFDAIAVGDVNDGSARIKRLHDMIDGIEHGRNEGLLKCDHMIHLRCEVSYPLLRQMFEPVAGHDLVRMCSVMDHTPGQRQFVSLDAYYTYYQGKFGLTDAEMEDFVEQRKKDQQQFSDSHRRMVVDMAKANKHALASHDDATSAHVEDAVRDEMTVAEFPTTVEAAKHSHEAGLAVMMGGPNLVRGGSHSGNVSAAELAEKGYLDIISSDYVPHGLLHGAMLLYRKFDSYDLPKAIRAISKTPADSVGLHDRGELAVGKRADFIRVHDNPHHPVIKAVWREGARVA